MGKPFTSELQRIADTLDVVNNLDITPFQKKINQLLDKPLYVVGSGGSFSACHLAALLHQQFGRMAQAITPLEAHSKQHSFHSSNVMFISASGRNKDILFGFKTALSQEPQHIISLCTTKNSPLHKLTVEYSIASIFECILPSGKDGFLASNSLVAFFALLIRVYQGGENLTIPATPQLVKKNIENYLKKITPRHCTHTVLYGPAAQPVAVDIESKFTEAALGATLLADFRNFGHGRHHWFAKRAEDSSLIALITPDIKELAEKTLHFVPKSISVLRLETKLQGFAGCLDLLIQSFYLAEATGKSQGIDPGRPGVPGFGRKLYNLNYYNTLSGNSSTTTKTSLAIQRKIRPGSLEQLTSSQFKKWEKDLTSFSKRLTATSFGAIIFDYDRTLCSDDNRAIGPDPEIIAEINRLLDKKFIIAIATGRGQSIRLDMQRLIPDRKKWEQIIIGYYNGADLGFLHNNDLPSTNEQPNEVIQAIMDELQKQGIAERVQCKIRPHQLTIESISSNDWAVVKESVYHHTMRVPLTGFMVLESSRSVDIIRRPDVSKLNIIRYCQEILKKRKLSYHCLCIGDKGKWPGNDFELLSSEFSLSVDEVSGDPHTCWNLSPLGVRNTASCLFYLRNLRTGPKGMKYVMR
ncbi:MAG: HAD hydrolase family protein [Sediminibacterium sp.]|nr:HAD hydrolase family protein [Sediminibacterium sp.]